MTLRAASTTTLSVGGAQASQDGTLVVGSAITTLDATTPVNLDYSGGTGTVSVDLNDEPTDLVNIDYLGSCAYIDVDTVDRTAAPYQPTIASNAYTVASGDRWLVISNGTTTVTLTLPTASLMSGRVISIRNITACTVNSGSSDVVPLAGGAAGTAILTNTAGKYATLVSNGTNWLICEAN